MHSQPGQLVVAARSELVGTAQATKHSPMHSGVRITHSEIAMTSTASRRFPLDHSYVRNDPPTARFGGGPPVSNLAKWAMHWFMVDTNRRAKHHFFVSAVF